MFKTVLRDAFAELQHWNLFYENYKIFEKVPLTWEYWVFHATVAAYIKNKTQNLISFATSKFVS